MARRRIVTIRYGLPMGMEQEELVKKFKRVADRNDITMKVLVKTDDGHTILPNRETQILELLDKADGVDDPDGYASWDRTMNGLAETLDIHASVASRYLKDLVKKRFVRFNSKSIIGRPRRQRAYYLTPPGRRLLEDLNMEGKGG